MRCLKQLARDQLSTTREGYSHFDVRTLLEKLDEPCRSIVAIAVLTGLRIGEILALRWKRVDLMNEVLEVAETFSSGEFGPPKTRSSRRTIPMSATLVTLLKQLRPTECEPERTRFCNLERDTSQSKEPVQPATGAGV